MKKSFGTISVALIGLLVLSACAVKSDPLCRAPTTIKSGLGIYDVPVLAFAHRIDTHQKEELVRRFNTDAISVSYQYCAIGVQIPCMPDFHAARKSDVNKSRGGFSSPPWTVLVTPQPTGFGNLFKVMPNSNNLGCKNEIEVDWTWQPPPSTTPPSTWSEEEVACNPPNPAFTKLKGWTDVKMNAIVLAGQTISSVGDAATSARATTLTTGWTASVNAACTTSNPGRNCVGALDNSPDFTSTRGVARNSRGILSVTYQLSLKNTVKGVCY